jgi:hypothetical protein
MTMLASGPRRADDAVLETRACAGATTAASSLTGSPPSCDAVR